MKRSWKSTKHEEINEEKGGYSDSGGVVNKSKLAPEFNFILIHYATFDWIPVLI